MNRSDRNTLILLIVFTLGFCLSFFLPSIPKHLKPLPKKNIIRQVIPNNSEGVKIQTTRKKLFQKEKGINQSLTVKSSTKSKEIGVDKKIIPLKENHTFEENKIYIPSDRNYEETIKQDIINLNKLKEEKDNSYKLVNKNSYQNNNSTNSLVNEYSENITITIGGLVTGSFKKNVTINPGISVTISSNVLIKGDLIIGDNSVVTNQGIIRGNVYTERAKFINLGGSVNGLIYNGEGY